MNIKSTLALTLVFGMTAIGGSAQEAPNTGPFHSSITASDRGLFTGRSVVRSAGYGTDRGQIFLFADPEKELTGERSKRPGLFRRLARFFKSGAGDVTVPADRAIQRDRRVARATDRQIDDRRFGYFLAPGLDKLRAQKTDRRAAKSDERRARLKRKTEKSHAKTRRLGKQEERRLAARLAHGDVDKHRREALAARMGPDRGSASWISRTLASFRIEKPVTSDRKYGLIVERYARSYGVPVDLAHAVIKVESNYRVNARGRAGEIGLMQIKPATARLMGYSGSAKGLYSPETNIKYGMKYLAKAHKLGGGSTCGTILKYNAGHAARRMNPISARYCAKVKKHLRGV